MISRLIIPILLAAIAYGCAGDSMSQLIERGRMRTKILAQTRYVPISADSIAGCYQSSNGFSGIHIDLYKEGRYKLQHWYDIIDPSQVDVIEIGRFVILGDAMLMKTEAFVHDSLFSTDSYNSLAAYITVPPGKLAPADSTVLPATYAYHFNKVNNSIYLVEAGFGGYFADEVEKNRQDSTRAQGRGTKLSSFFPMKIDPRNKGAR